MALFPTTPVLETFTGALVSPPNASWTRINAAGADIQQDGTGLGNNQSISVGAHDYWNPGTFGPDCEAYLTVTTLPASGILRLHVRVANPGNNATRNGYQVQWT